MWFIDGKEAAFLPVEIIAEAQPVLTEANLTETSLNIKLASSYRLNVNGAFDLYAVARFARSLGA